MHPRNYTSPGPISEWGPILWRLLHSLAVEVAPLQMFAVLYHLADCLPKTAGDHLREYLQLYRLAAGADLPRYLFELHNAVSARLGKPALPEPIRHLPPSQTPGFAADFKTIAQLLEDAAPLPGRHFRTAVQRSVPGLAGAV